MMEINDQKSSACEDADSSDSIGHCQWPAPTVQAEQPQSWIYRPLRRGKLNFPHYASPQVQLAIVALLCFLCPGMLNALNGLGGGGQVSAHDANNAAVGHYSTSAAFGFFAGSAVNRIGVRKALFLGALGYSLYIGSFLSYNRSRNSAFLVFAGTITGFTSGLLWTAQGVVMMSYPQEESKGRYISWFLGTYNTGSVIGSLVPLFENLQSKKNRVNDGTYIGLLTLSFCGAFVALFLLDIHKVKRPNGSYVTLTKPRSWQSEFLGLFKLIKRDRYILLLFPMFFSSAWFSPYQINDVNLARFNIRTRSLNNTLGAISTIISNFIFGYMLDLKCIRRRSSRAKLGHLVLFCVAMAVWSASFVWQKSYDRASVLENKEKIDFHTASYVAPMFLYISYGLLDAAWNTTLYWFMGALTNSPHKIANITGFFKGLQSAGAAISFRIDALDTPYMNELAACWALCIGSLLFAAPLVWLRIRDTEVGENVEGGEPEGLVMSEGINGKSEQD